MTLPQKLLAAALLLVAALVAAAPVTAQEALPDPAMIELPPAASSDPKVIDQGYKFFYFYRPDTSFAEAYADLRECRGFLKKGVNPPQSAFVPWVEPARRPVRPVYQPYGLVGALIGAMVVPKINRGIDNNIVRRCMEPRGYKRFPMPEDSWNLLNEGKDEQQNILKQAKLASGPAPTLPEVTEK